MDDISRYIETMNKIQNTINTPEIQAIQKQYAAIQNATNIIATQQIIADYNSVYDAVNALSLPLSQYHMNVDEIHSALSSMASFSNIFYQQEQIISNITQALQPILDGYAILNFQPKSRNKKQKRDADKISEKVVSEIYLPDDKKIITDDSPIITIKPANDKVFSYLAEHPNELYNLTSREFEEFMAQLYNKLGYNAELTKATRDGGKDIILRKPDILGDIVFYVECKQYNAKNKVGVDIIQRFAGIIEMDKVNGGIIATTSFFSSDAEKWIMEKDLNCRIQMHNFDTIQNMLKMAAV